MPIRRKATLGRRDTIIALRAFEHRLGKPLVARELARDRALYLATLRHFGSMAEARKAARLRAPRYQRRWTRELALRELVRAARSGVTITHQGLLAAKRQDLLGALWKFVGGLEKAREVTGIPQAPRQRSATAWTRSKVLAAVRARHKRGQPLAFSRVPATLRNAARTHVGSWRLAVEAIGLRYEAVRLRGWGLSDEELLAELRALARERPTMTLHELHHHRHGQTWRVRFGSLMQAANRAGLSGWPSSAGRTPGSARRVLRDLRARAADGLENSWPALRREAPDLERMVARYFPTLDAALKAAGLPPAREQRVRRARLACLLRLVRLARRGVPMRPHVVERNDRPLYDSLRRYFGSFRSAVALLGF